MREVEPIAAHVPYMVRKAFRVNATGGQTPYIFIQSTLTDTWMSECLINIRLTKVDMGNHEKAYQFSHYTERFRNMPISDWSEPIRTFNGPAPNNW